MTPTKQQISQINSINPDILKLGEEVLRWVQADFHPELREGYNKKIGELSGILSQCKSELEFLENKRKGYFSDLDTITDDKIMYDYFEEIQGWFDLRISALKVTIQFLEGVLK